LKHAGFEVREETRVYDVVLVDDQLPGWTGLDALRLLRALGSNTRSILVTELSERRAEDPAGLPAAAVRLALRRTRSEGGTTEAG
jgi:CheY-like chemotaxis protein